MSNITLIKPPEGVVEYTAHAVSSEGELFTHTSEATSKREAIVNLLNEVARKGWNDKGYIVTEVKPVHAVQEFNYVYKHDDLHENMTTGDNNNVSTK